MSSTPGIPDEESLFPRPKSVPKDWRDKIAQARSSSAERKGMEAQPEAPRPPEEKRLPSTSRVVSAKAPSAPRVPSAPPAPGVAPAKKSTFVRNVLRAAAVIGAASGIALLAHDRGQRATPKAVVPVEGAVARSAPQTPSVSLEKPIEKTPENTRMPAVEKSASTPPAVPAPAPEKKTKKSLRELAKRSHHHEAVARILLELDPTHPDETQTLTVANEITALGAPAVPAIRDMLVEIDEEADRRVLGLALANMKDEGAADAAGEALALVDDQQVQMTLLRALPETTSSSEAIASAYGVEPNGETRMILLHEYFRRLGISTDSAPPDMPVAVPEPEVDAFLRIVVVDRDPAIRREALRLIEERAAPRDMNLAEEVYKTASDAQTRRAALLAYGATAGEAGVPFLVELAGSNDVQQRLQAVDAMGVSRCSSAIAAVESITKNDADVRVKKHAQRVLAKMREDG